MAMKIDAHQHFWLYNPDRDAWITEEMGAIRKDFLPGDLKNTLEAAGFGGTVAVQADQSESETEFLLGLSEAFEFIQGVVGWTNLRSPAVYERLELYSQFEKMKGFRHIVQTEPAGFLLDPQFIRGVRQLAAFDFTYDLLIYPHQLEEACQFAGQLPDNPLVIDHLAKPAIKTGHDLADWKKYMKILAGYPNVCCKLSGMVTEADWKTWTPETFYPYLDEMLEAFGPDRLLYGSDWPVCLVAATYEEVAGIVHSWASRLSAQEQEAVFGKNAIRFYQLDV